MNLKCTYSGTDTPKYGEIIMIDWKNGKLTWNDGLSLTEYKIVKRRGFGSDIEDMFNAYQVNDSAIRKREHEGSYSYQFSLDLMYVSLYENSAAVNFAQAYRLSIYHDKKELILMPEKKGSYTDKDYFGVIFSLECLYM